MSYVATPYDNSRSTNTIAELMLRQGQIRAQGLRAQGDASAAIAGSLGDLAVNGTRNVLAAREQARQTQRQQAQDAERTAAATQARQMGGMQIADLQQSQAFRSALNTTLRNTPQITEDGVSVYNVPEIAKTLADQGFGANAADVTKALGGLNEAFRAERSAKLSLVQRGANEIARSGNDPGLALHFLDTLETNGTYPKETIAQYRQFIQADPTNVAKLTSMLGGEHKLSTAGPGSTVFDDVTRQPVLSVPNRPVAPTAEVSNERYRAIQSAIAQQQPVSAADQAWASSYEKEKGLTADRSASAASERQATTIAAQTAQQSRAQDFTEKQAGRKELTDKVEAPYQTAVSSANTLRETVAAAKAGNKVAGSLQTLETAMSAIRAQGLNRINMSEIHMAGDAGNLWDHVVGWFGKAEAGQPIPANIQDDMVKFADILEAAAQKKYLDGFTSVTKRYGLTDETPLVRPAAAGVMRARDPQGVLHEAPAGTSLPAGWVLER